MEFTNILSGHDCDCLKNSEEDRNTLFAIKTMKKDLRVQDFQSYWEKGKINEENSNCEKECSFRGISVSIFNDNTKDAVESIYKELFPLAPKYRPFVSVIKFYESSGVIKHTPNELNTHHYDFYKSDAFDFSKVVVIHVNELH